jgi:hypothetical protein
VGRGGTAGGASMKRKRTAARREPTSARYVNVTWGTFIPIEKVMEAHDVKVKWGGPLTYNETDEFLTTIRSLSPFDSDLFLDDKGNVVPMSEALGLASGVAGAPGQNGGRRLPPKFAEALLCSFTPRGRHAEWLGDFEELYCTVWHPRFGWFANVIYCAQALRLATGMLRVAAWAAVVDRVIRAFGSS